MQLRHLLAASDDSPEGYRAANAGLALAAQSGAGLTLLHVLELLEAPAASEQRSHEELLAQLHERAHALLQPFRERAQRLGVDCRVELIPGAEPWRVIDERAQALCCDLLIVGRHRRSWLDTSKVGNQLWSLTARAVCEVLVVP